MNISKETVKNLEAVLYASAFIVFFGLTLLIGLTLYETSESLCVSRVDTLKKDYDVDLASNCSLKKDRKAVGELVYKIDRMSKEEAQKAVENF